MNRIAAAGGGWLPLFGFLPVFWAFFAGLAGAIVGTVCGRPPVSLLNARAFGGP